MAGTYQLALIDSQGCGTTVSFTIGNLPPFSVNVNTVDAKCNGGTDPTTGRQAYQAKKIMLGLLLEIIQLL